MPLVLALKNRSALVVGTDAHALSGDPLEFGQMMNIPGEAILLMAGDIEAVRHPITQIVLPKLTPATSAVAVAQLVHAALIMETLPRLDEVAGRIEIIIAGIDPIRHVQEPNLYYLDSAQDFQLKIVNEDFIAAGSTAAVSELLTGYDLKSADVLRLSTLAKDCLATTKMRWPEALGSHQRIGVIDPAQTKINNF